MQLVEVASTLMKTPTLLHHQAFSLAELLVVIAVIAIIAAVVVPAIAGITSSAGASKNLRNAQSIATTYNAAIAAGMPTNVASDVPGAVAVIMAGTNFNVGNTTHYFSVDGLSEGEATNAISFLGFQNGTVRYSP